MAATIAIVANTTWNIYNFRLPLIKALKQSGYRVLVIAPVDEYIHYLNDSYFTRHIPIKYLNAQRKNPFSDLLFLFELFSIYRREKPDIVFHYTIKPNIYGSLAARWNGILSIPTVTGLGYAFLHSNLLNRGARLLYQLALRDVPLAVFHNPTDRDFFVREGIISRNRGNVIPGSGVNTNHFRPLPKPKKNKFIFLFIGRLLVDKGIREYVNAARQLKRLAPQAECWAVGQLNDKNSASIDKAKLLQWVANHDIRYFGSTLDVRSYLKQVDVFVLPSYREGMPRAVLEAMAMGKPIITTDTAGCRNAIDEQCGLTVPPGDSLALAEAMVKFYHKDTHELEDMGRAARQRVLKYYNDKIIVQEYLKICNHILENPVKAKTRLIQK
ncbi:MAG: glycosyltransferase family 4 protein [Chitinophagales bacterium]|nr:glycosyltransferase family 4 protein [Chitinophagales bacterium]